jgi:hypothetical protein
MVAPNDILQGFHHIKPVRVFGTNTTFNPGQPSIPGHFQLFY